MLIRDLNEAQDTARHTKTGNWDSVRLLLASDGMGFSFHITTLYAGTETHMWYKHHVESVYCISGRAEIEDKTTGRRYALRPGMLYALDQHDRHVLRVGPDEDFVCACVFNPPLRGTEVHDEDGAYLLDAEEVRG
ncbi:MAG TPA: ectoine synthase [Pseudomonadales bacterium]